MKLTVVPPTADRTASPSFGLADLVAPALATIVACYAAAVVIRVIVAYGT